MHPIIQYIFLTARRDWLFLGIFLLLVFDLLVAVIIGSTSLVEQMQTITALLAGSIRLLIILGICLFTCFHVKRSFENREIDFFLSKPISRYSFVITYYLGLLATSLVLIVPVILFMICLSSMHLLYGNYASYLAFGASLIVESMVVIAFALFASLLLKSATAAMLATVGFYVLSRIVGFFVLMFQNPILLGGHSILGDISKKALQLIAMLFPRFDMFTQSEWLIYGHPEMGQFLYFMGTGLLYTVLILCMSFYDFKRHEF